MLDFKCMNFLRQINMGINIHTFGLKKALHTDKVTIYTCVMNDP